MFLLLLFLPFSAVAQQDCVTGIHLFKDGSRTATAVNSCGRPLNCTFCVEGLTTRGDKISDTKGFLPPAGGSQAMSVGGVERCGNFDLQCTPAAAAPRKR